MRPLTRLTCIGTTIPIALFLAAAALDVPILAIVALAVATLSPALGHVVYRRKLFTRGTLVRLLGGGLAGLFVLAAQNARDLGDALGLVFAFAVITLVAFVAGTVLDFTSET